MLAWLSYRPEDFLLFTPRTYWRLFELANAQVWPLHLPILLLGAAVVVWVVRPRPWSDRAVAGLVALAWTSAGGWFIGTWYALINWAAAYMVPLFIAEAVLFARLGLVRRRPRFATGDRASGLIGFALLAYALILHPLGRAARRPAVRRHRDCGHRARPDGNRDARAGRADAARHGGTADARRPAPLVHRQRFDPHHDGRVGRRDSVGSGDTRTRGTPLAPG